MFTGTENRTKVGFLPIEFDLPSTEDSSLFTQVMNERERETATVMNQKENSLYALEESVNSQVWFFQANVQSSGFRRMYLVPPLVAGGSVSIPHELGDITNFTFTDFKGWVQDAAGTTFRPISALFIEVTVTDIVLTVPAASVYDTLSGQLVLEFVKS